MGLLSTPLYLLGPPLLFIVSFPLAIFAAITTSLALSLLAARASMVYFELAVALLHASLFPEPPKPMPRRAAPPPSSPRIRRTSTASQDIAPAARLQRKSGSSASLLNASIPANARDYEGVGGWRYYEGEEEEALWMGMNKRLELPLALPPGRRHQRRHTGEEPRWPGSPEVFRMSPLQSRMRTPQRTPKRTASPAEEAEGDEYFPKQSLLRPLSTAMEPLSASVQHSRRASVVSVGVYNHMYKIKQSRNHCAHELGVDEHRDQPIFAKIRQSYIALLALLDVLSGKVKAAIEDEDAWVKGELDAWVKEDSWVTDHPFEKMRRCEYAQEPPEVEAILLAQEEKRETGDVEYETFEKVAKLAWANNEPGTEQYDAEWKYVHYAWLEAQGIELDEWVDEYPTDYEEDPEPHRPMETSGGLRDDSDEETTSEQDETTAEASGGIQDECNTEGSEW